MTSDLVPTAPPAPAVPDAPSEWQAIQAQAAILAKSGVVPQAYRGKPDDIIAAALYGREVGWGITTALTHIHLIQGRPSLSAQGMCALVRARGHSIGGGMNDTEATVTGKRNDTGDTMTVTWTIAMAKTAGLAGKDTWKQYPAAMLWARAVSQLCRSLFADVILGLQYTPEEVLSFVDVDEVTDARTLADEQWHARIGKLYEKARTLSENEREAVRLLKLERGIPTAKLIKDYDEEEVAWLEDILGGPVDTSIVAAGDPPEAEVDG